MYSKFSLYPLSSPKPILHLHLTSFFQHFLFMNLIPELLLDLLRLPDHPMVPITQCYHLRLIFNLIILSLLDLCALDQSLIIFFVESGLIHLFCKDLVSFKGLLNFNFRSVLPLKDYFIGLRTAVDHAPLLSDQGQLSYFEFYM